ncbi:hypothetical protein M8494_33080 [Serratia ureilytica]
MGAPAASSPGVEAHLFQRPRYLPDLLFRQCLFALGGGIFLALVAVETQAAAAEREGIVYHRPYDHAADAALQTRHKIRALPLCSKQSTANNTLNHNNPHSPVKSHP